MSPHRTESPGADVNRWRCAFDTYREFRDYVASEYGLAVADAKNADWREHAPFPLVAFKVGARHVEADVVGNVFYMSGDRRVLVWSNTDGETGILRGLIK